MRIVRANLPTLSILVLVLMLVAACAPAPTPAPTPTLPAEVTPTAEPVPELMLIAFYASGTADELQVFAVTETGESISMDHLAFRGASVSPFGTYLALPSSPPPAPSVTIVDLRTPRQFEVGQLTDLDTFSMAFEDSEQRLAILEVSAPSAEEVSWALLVANLLGEGVTRFPARSWMEEGARLPGYPLGWIFGGFELLLDTFVPYTDAGGQGVIALELRPDPVEEPPRVQDVPLEELAWREVLPAEAYDTVPRLSSDATALLYLDRDPDYLPDAYDPLGFDLAVNRLWTLSFDDPEAIVEPDMWLAVDDGSALARVADWSPDGAQILYAQGTYDGGETFASVELKIHDAVTPVRQVTELPLPEERHLVGLDWCRPELALVTTAESPGDYELTLIDVIDGTSRSIAAAATVEVLGCVNELPAAAE